MISRAAATRRVDAGRAVGRRSSVLVALRALLTVLLTVACTSALSVQATAATAAGWPSGAGMIKGSSAKRAAQAFVNCFTPFTNRSYHARAPRQCFFEGVPDITAHEIIAVRLRWSHWGAPVATATGIQKSNHPGQCHGDPACLSFPIKIRLSRIRHEICSSTLIYTRITTTGGGRTGSMYLNPSNAPLPPGCHER